MVIWTIRHLINWSMRGEEMGNLEENNQKEYYDFLGEKIEVLKTIKKNNYTIKILKQDHAEKNLEGLYRCVGELLYRHATK